MLTVAKANKKKRAGTSKNPVIRYFRDLKLNIKINWELYLFVLPLVAYYIIFKYVPIYGIQIAFRDYNLIDGVTGSPWAGLKHFITFFNTPFAGNII